MKILQYASAYSKKRNLRTSSPDIGVLPPLNTNAVREMELTTDSKSPRLISPIIFQATQNVRLKLYELLDMAELMRAAYEKGELASVQNRLSLLMVDASNLALSISSVLERKQHEKEHAETMCKRFDIVALLHEVSGAARLIVGDKPVTVMDANCSTPVVIYSDPSMIKQIMTGLMSNAAKFTARGRIALILSIDDDKIRLTVADTGKGMTPEEIQAVFESFDYKQDDEMNSLATSGLGLRIVKALVKKLDGKISLASKPGEGTIVEVSLPLKAPL
jgi:signal transduction histidine kinase